MPSYNHQRLQASLIERLPPLSLYIHIPWCVRKCPYCDFNSHKKPSDINEHAFLQALLNDLQQELCYIQGRMIQSIFIGGGTPSLLSADFYQTLFLNLKKMLSFAQDIEITLEANPGTVEQQRFAAYRAIGINRLSIGVQSFQDDKLKALGRIHDAATAKQAVLTAKKAGFLNFNIDLMHGLPEQSVEDACHDLQTAIELQPTHLSWYQLTIEPNTIFYKYTPTLPSSDLCFAIEEAGKALLLKHGYEAYEVSAYSQGNKQCWHNLNYWQFGDYLGIGPGAHGKLTLLNEQQIIRRVKIRAPQSYLASNGNYLAEQKTLTSDECLFEFMLNALRLKQSIAFDLFTERTGLPINVLKEYCGNKQLNEFIFLNSNNFELTTHGHRYLDSVMLHFLPENTENN